MKNAYISTFILITFFCLLGNQGKCDHILVNGVRVNVVSGRPFGSYPGIAKLSEQLKDYGTECTEDNCQFDAEWKIVNHQLFLVQIHSCECNAKKQTANLAKLFKGSLKKGMLKADWFTGKIWLTNDRPFTWFCMVCPIWARETYIIVAKGVVTDIKEVVYPPAPDPYKMKTIDSLTNLVYGNIHWDDMPNLTQQARHIRLSFTSDSVGKPFNIQTDAVDQPADSTWIAEAKKAIMRFQWPLYFSHGTAALPYWPLDLIFSKEQQKAHTKKLH